MGLICLYRLTDAQRTICLLREHASGLKISKVGVLGCSAGGHLASMAATHFIVGNRPDFRILLYSVITMEAAYAHKRTRIQLLGGEPSDELEKWLMEEIIRVSDK